MTSPNVVTKIRRGVDPDGPWKQAIVTGRRFPVVAFHDPSYEAFVADLVRSGCQVPMTTPVEDDRVRKLNGSGDCHGNTTLEAILGFEKAGLFGKSADLEPLTMRKRASP